MRSPVAEAGESALEKVGRGGGGAAHGREDGGEPCRHLRDAGFCFYMVFVGVFPLSSHR
jgi:hypothetical protein